MAYLMVLLWTVGQAASQPRMLPSLARLKTRDPVATIDTTLALWACHSCNAIPAQASSSRVHGSMVLASQRGHPCRHC